MATADRAEQAGRHTRILSWAWALIGVVTLIGIASGRSHDANDAGYGLIGTAALVNGVSGLWRKRLIAVLTIVLSFIVLIGGLGQLLAAIGTLTSGAPQTALAIIASLIVLIVTRPSLGMSIGRPLLGATPGDRAVEVLAVATNAFLVLLALYTLGTMTIFTPRAQQTGVERISDPGSSGPMERSGGA